LTAIAATTGALLFTTLNHADDPPPDDYPVTASNDMDGDDADDAVDAAPSGDDPNGGDPGFVVVSSSDGGAVTLTGREGGDWFGASVAVAGDLNSDGFADLIVGAPKEQDGEGRAYVFYGPFRDYENPELNVEDADMVFRSPDAGDFEFGTFVRQIADADCDGTPDVGIGGFFFDGQGNQITHSYVVSGATGAPVYHIVGTAPFDPWFEAVGDAEGDGDVDQADLDIVNRNMGRTGADLTMRDGEINGDARVDAADRNLLLANFGFDLFVDIRDCGNGCPQQIPQGFHCVEKCDDEWVVVPINVWPECDPIICPQDSWCAYMIFVLGPAPMQVLSYPPHPIEWESEVLIQVGPGGSGGPAEWTIVQGEELIEILEITYDTIRFRTIDFGNVLIRCTYDPCPGYCVLDIPMSITWVDSDSDGLPDNWEIILGLDPNDPDTNGDGILDGDEDADGDGLSNHNEFIYSTDPLNPDSDGDGVNDGDEVDQGSNPNDPSDEGIAPDPDDLVDVTLQVGDSSGSHSELWLLKVGDIRFKAPGYGEVTPPTTFQFLRGESYPIKLVHLGSNISPPDYDYTTLVTVASEQCASIDDPQNLLGVHWSDECASGCNPAAGKEATLYLPKIELVGSDGESVDNPNVIETAPFVEITNATVLSNGQQVAIAGRVTDNAAPVEAVTIEGQTVQVTQFSGGDTGPFEGVFSATIAYPLPTAPTSYMVEWPDGDFLEDFGNDPIDFTVVSGDWASDGASYGLQSSSPSPVISLANAGVVTRGYGSSEVLLGTADIADILIAHLTQTDLILRIDEASDVLMIVKSTGTEENVVGSMQSPVASDTWNWVAYSLAPNQNGFDVSVTLNDSSGAFTVENVPSGELGVRASSTGVRYDNFYFAKTVLVQQVSKPPVVEEYQYEVVAENSAGEIGIARVSVGLTFSDDGYLVSADVLGSTSVPSELPDASNGVFRVRARGLESDTPSMTGTISTQAGSSVTLNFEQEGDEWLSQGLALVSPQAQPGQNQLQAGFGSSLVAAISAPMACEMQSAASMLQVVDTSGAPVKEFKPSFVVDVEQGIDVAKLFVRATRPGSSGAQLSVQLSSKNNAGEAITPPGQGTFPPSTQAITVYRQSNDENSPNYNIYLSSPAGQAQRPILCVVDGVPASGVGNGIVHYMQTEGGFLIAELGSDKVQVRANSTAIVFLTFDDGPLFGTDDVLDVLDEVDLQGQATFLDVGLHINQTQFSFKQPWRGKKNWTGPEIVQMTRDLGNLVANHSYTHANNQYQQFYANPGGVLADFNQCATTLTNVLGAGGAGYNAHFGRLPGRNTWRAGGVNRTDGDSGPAADLLGANGYSLFGWDSEYRQGAHSEAERTKLLTEVKNRAAGKVSPRKPGKIILLFHDQNHRNSQGGHLPLRLFLQSLKDAKFRFAELDGF
jgi:peptidoglycan/xylan/chitin deacetylase (PgdA/CDA1 family)